MEKTVSKILSYILTATLLVGCSAAPAGEQTQATAPAETTAQEETSAEPKVGDMQHGFAIKDIIPMNPLGATGILYEHEKSGAELLYLDCEDTNRSFDITFRTPALDDKGKPHVFEHITICGSQKYPDANMFFAVYNQTYNTYVNAVTYHGMTSYPLASLSEEQLMTMMDYYLSGVFQPLLYTEPKLAQREAWRYELADVDSDLNIAGTVYSEMQGALTLSAQAYDNNSKALYQDSTTAHESGGIPESIRTLTYEELVDFHDTYYHPSNALITLYGDLDIDRFLEYIDREYLAGFEKKEINVDMGTIDPYTETRYMEYEVAVEEGAATEQASDIYYSFALNGADLKDSIAMDVLTDAFSQESSPVMGAVRGKLPNAQISTYIDFDTPSVPHVAFVAQGVDPEDRDSFVAAVDEGLATLAADGMAADILESAITKKKVSLLTKQEDVDLGVNASLAIAQGWTYFGTVDYYAEYEQVMDDMTKSDADTMIQKYFTENLHRAVSVTKPVAGLAEKNDAVLAEELAAKKNSMSETEIADMVKNTSDFVEWGNTPASEEIVSKIVNMDVANLPEEKRHYDIKEETADGVRYLSSAVDVDDVFSGGILLDGSTIPIEKLQDVQACLMLMGQLDTSQHSKEELSTLITRYLPEITKTIDAPTGYHRGGIYEAKVSWIGLTEDADQVTKLLTEILFDTDFSDTSAIKNNLSRTSSDFMVTLDEEPVNIQIRRCRAMFNDYNAYTEYVNDYDMYQYMQEMMALAESNPEELTKRLDAARDLLLNRTGATALLIGNDEAISAYQTGINGILSRMTAEERPTVDYSSLRIPARNEGLVVNSTVQMNMQITDDYHGFSGRDFVTNGLIDDMYMLPQLRNALGAYGAYSVLQRYGAILYTYRDPNLKSSYDIFQALPDYLKTAEFSQEDVNDYILGSYSSISRPLGLLSGAVQAMTDYLVGDTEEMRITWMKEAKAVTVDDIKGTADTWSSLVEHGFRSTSGSESTLKASGDLFDVLIYPDGTVKEMKDVLKPAA